MTFLMGGKGGSALRSMDWAIAWVALMIKPSQMELLAIGVAIVEHKYVKGALKLTFLSASSTLKDRNQFIWT